MTDLPKLLLEYEPSGFQNRNVYQQKNYNWSQLMNYGLSLSTYFQGIFDGYEIRVNNLISGVEQPSEIVDARTKKDGTIEPNLKSRLDSYDDDLNNIRVSRTVFPFKALISSFSGTDTKSLDLYVSNDYQHLIPINKTKPLGLESDSIGDPSLHYVNGKFLLTYSSLSTIGAAISDDLVTWGNVSIKDTGAAETWAPDIFVDDDGTIYLLSTGGSSNLEMSLFIAKVTDITNMDSLVWQEITLPDPDNHTTHIDPTVIKFNGKYYLAIKDETDGAKNIQIYSSTDLTTWAYVTTPDFGRMVEGPSMINVDGIVYLYADGYSTRSSWRLETKDMSTWENLTQVYSTDASRTQHFTITPINDSSENDLIQKAISFFNNTNHGFSQAQKILAYPETDLTAGTNEIYPEDGLPQIYVLPYGTGGDAEVSLHLDKITHVTKIYFLDLDNTYKIKVMSNDAFAMPRPANPYWIEYTSRNYFGVSERWHILELTSLGSFDLSDTTQPFYVSNGLENDSGFVPVTLTTSGILDSSKNNLFLLRRKGDTIYASISIFPLATLKAGTYKIADWNDYSNIEKFYNKNITLTAEYWQGFAPQIAFEDGSIYLRVGQDITNLYENYFNGPVWSHFV
jgi:hypothetical protein